MYLSSNHERYYEYVTGEDLRPGGPCLCKCYTADTQKEQNLDKKVIKNY